MPEVYNWHLGRKMLYPYEETASEMAVRLCV